MNRAEILSPPVRDVFILDQTNLTQALLECFNERLVISVGGGTNREKSKSDRTFALLRARRERPRSSSAAEQRDELPPFHVEHGGLPLCAVRSVFRHLSLPQRCRPVLGADLNCSESRCWPAPQVPPARRIAHGERLDGHLEEG